MKASDARQFRSASYGEEELEVFANALLLLPDEATLVEIGCQYGSSTSAIMLAAKGKDWNIYCIDPFYPDGDRDVRPLFVENMRQFDVHYILLQMTSEDAVGKVPACDFLHIDGDHTREGVKLDCDLYLPKLKSGGIVVFHDYGRCGAPDVQPLADEYTKGWEVIHADGLKVARKP